MALSLVHNSTVSDALLQKHIRFISAARQKKDEANGDYLAAVKRAKADGCPQKQLIAAMQARKQDPDQVAIELRDYIRCLALCNIPVHQPDLFERVPTAEAGGEVEELTRSEPDAEEHELWEAVENGREAGRRGRSRADNPHPPGTQLYVKWDDGLTDGVQLVAKKHGSKAKVASTRRPRRDPEAALNLNS